MENTELGVVALSCAAIDDVTAWCLLAFVVGVAQCRGGRRRADHRLGASATSRSCSSWCGRWRCRLLGHDSDPSAASDGRVGAGGAAVFGADGRMDRHPRDFRRLPAGRHHSARQRRGPRLPATSSRTSSRSCCCRRSLPTPACGPRSAWCRGWEAWLFCGGDHPGRHARQVRRHGRRRAIHRARTGDSSAALGILMNTRGLMELIVLNIGLELGVISPKLFAMMVIMALVDDDRHDADPARPQGGRSAPRHGRQADATTASKHGQVLVPDVAARRNPRSWIRTNSACRLRSLAASLRP